MMRSFKETKHDVVAFYAKALEPFNAIENSSKKEAAIAKSLIPAIISSIHR
jgi:hypothetical protein